MTTDNQRLAGDVNRMYWESNASVGEITDEMGISRRTLYEVLRPYPADDKCPNCGERMVYMNRTARSAGEAECLNCGKEEEPAAAAGARTRRRTPESPDGEQLREGGRRSPVDAEAAALSGRALALGGAMLAGAAIGAVTTYLVRRR